MVGLALALALALCDIWNHDFLTAPRVETNEDGLKSP